MPIQEKIKNLLEYSVLFTEDQKKTWLDLIPKMNDAELSELLGILVDEVNELKKEGIDLIEDEKLEAELIAKEAMAPVPSHGASLEALKAAVSVPAPPAKPNVNFAQELKKEVTTPEIKSAPAEPGLNAPAAAPKPAVAVKPKPVDIPAPKPAAAKIHIPNVTLGLNSLNDIKSLDDLKKVEVTHLRQGDVQKQTDLIHIKIMNVAQSKRILPYYAVVAFEQSPLYKTYLTMGSLIITDPNPDRKVVFKTAVDKFAATGNEPLTIAEFEAIADLRKQIEQV